MPGHETPQVLQECGRAELLVRRFAAENKIPLYTGRASTLGPAPVVLILAALIEENAHLKKLINIILEPVQ